MRIKVVLISVSVDWTDGKFLTSSRNKTWEPFSDELLDRQPMEVLKELFNEIVNLHPEWASFIPLGNEIIDGELCLIYSVQIPIDSMWNGCVLIDSGYVPEDHPYREYLVKAVRRVT